MGGADVLVTNPLGVVEMEVLVDPVAGLDVHKKTVTCVRVPGEGRERVEHKQTFPTFRADLESMRDWLAGHHVSVVVMEATGVYWRPVVRHEAPCDRGEVRGLPRWAVAAAC